jgi:initiation factor 1A
MVKNLGGKHGKKIARKNAHSNSEVSNNKKMRFASGEEELYGLVTKCLGNGQFLIMCIDQVERLCILRNKFTGRNKQSNLISIGSWVIIGLRNWETCKPGKKEKCDMLEVYTNNEKHKLLEECKTNLSFLTQQENILLNIDEQEEEGNEYLTFSEGKTNNGSGDNGDNEQEDDGLGAGGGVGGGDDDNIDDMIDIDEI